MANNKSGNNNGGSGQITNLYTDPNSPLNKNRKKPQNKAAQNPPAAKKPVTTQQQKSQQPKAAPRAQQPQRPVQQKQAAPIRNPQMKGQTQQKFNQKALKQKKQAGWFSKKALLTTVGATVLALGGTFLADSFKTSFQQNQNNAGTGGATSSVPATPKKLENPGGFPAQAQVLKDLSGSCYDPVQPEHNNNPGKDRIVDSLSRVQKSPTGAEFLQKAEGLGMKVCDLDDLNTYLDKTNPDFEKVDKVGTYFPDIGIVGLSAAKTVQGYEIPDGYRDLAVINQFQNGFQFIADGVAPVTGDQYMSLYDQIAQQHSTESVAMATETIIAAEMAGRGETGAWENIDPQMKHVYEREINNTPGQNIMSGDFIQRMEQVYGHPDMSALDIQYTDMARRIKLGYSESPATGYTNVDMPYAEMVKMSKGDIPTGDQVDFTNDHYKNSGILFNGISLSWENDKQFYVSSVLPPNQDIGKLVTEIDNRAELIRSGADYKQVMSGDIQPDQKTKFSGVDFNKVLKGANSGMDMFQNLQKITAKTSRLTNGPTS